MEEELTKEYGMTISGEHYLRLTNENIFELQHHLVHILNRALPVFYSSMPSPFPDLYALDSSVRELQSRVQTTYDAYTDLLAAVQDFARTFNMILSKNVE